MSLIEAVREIQAKREALHVELAAIAKDAFAEEAERLFEAHPELQSFSWTQYTPHFNDGEACTFRLNTEDPRITFVGATTDEEDEDDYDSYFSSWAANRRVSAGTPEPGDVAGLAVVAFLGEFDEDTYLEMFGDGVRVTVTRGQGTSVDDHEHD